MESIPISLIEELLKEFHLPQTNNQRKREIESQLIEYQHNPIVWAHCLYQLTNNNNSNQYLWFFNVSAIEVAITRKWDTLNKSDRNTIRDTLWTYYTNLKQQQHETVSPKLKREKSAQLIALIAKHEFPTEYPDFMNRVTALLQTEFNLGITLLRATSDELVSTKDDISSERKKNFSTAMMQCMPDIFELLNQYIVLYNYRLNNCQIDCSGEDSTLIQSLLSVIPADENSFIFSAVELLTCLQHLFTWVSLENVISETLVVNLFDLANWKEHGSDISVASVAAMNELLYRQMALPRVKTIAKGIKLILEQNNLKCSNELYQDKLTELLKLFTSQHWNQWVDNEDIYEIVTLLYQFTFSGYGALAFTERLTIWSPIIQGLASSGFGRYVEIVHLLISGILRKMQFRFDQDGELDTLDNESLDDNMETEWQHYLSQCIETIVLTAEGRPIQVFEQVFTDWQRPFEMFMSLEKLHDGTALNIKDYHKCHLIHSVIRDLTSLCQTLTSLIPILQTYPDELPDNLHQLSYSLTYAIGFLSRSKLHGLNVIALPQLTGDFIEFYAQILSSLRCFLGWSLALQNEPQIKSLIENVAYTLLPATNTSAECKVITLAAAQLLLSITSHIRPKYSLDCTSLCQLIQSGNNLDHMDRQATIFVQQAIVNCFVLPWNNVNVSEQEFDRRTALLQQYINCVAQDLIRLDHCAQIVGQDDKVAKITTSVLPILKDILDNYNDQTSSVKNMLLLAFKSIIVKSISLFSSFGTTNEHIGMCVLNFTFSVIRTLQIQLGTTYVKEMLSIFLDAATREQLTSANVKSIDKLLQMLLLVVEQPGNASLSLLPETLKLALDFVVPLLMKDKSNVDFGDVTISLFSLFDGILHHRWQYFYKSQVLRGFSPLNTIEPDQCDDDDQSPQNADQFHAILMTYGQALVGSNDPHITRIVLTSLQSLNERWKLFSRKFFKLNLLTSFHCALIRALISPEGALHIDYLLSVLFTMGQVSSSTLHASFISLGYAGDSKIIKDICLATDLPTFTQYMNQIIQDTRCMQFTQ